MTTKKDKTILLGIVITAILVGSATFANDVYADDEHNNKKKQHFYAIIIADQEVIPEGAPDYRDDVTAIGFAKFVLHPNGEKMQYKIYAKNLQNVVGLHIHNGDFGVNHHDHLVDIIPTDLSNPQEPNKRGVLVKGVLKDEDVLAGGHHGGHGTSERTLDDLIHAFMTGNAYIQVHTSSDDSKDTNTGPGDIYTPGEIRGQVYPLPKHWVK